MSDQNSLCFPCLEKVRTKFPVFPVPWPRCIILIYLRNPSENTATLRSFSRNVLFRRDDVNRLYTLPDKNSDNNTDSDSIPDGYILMYRKCPHCTDSDSNCISLITTIPFLGWISVPGSGSKSVSNNVNKSIGKIKHVQQLVRHEITTMIRLYRLTFLFSFGAVTKSSGSIFETSLQKLSFWKSVFPWFWPNRMRAAWKQRVEIIFTIRVPTFLDWQNSIFPWFFQVF